MERIIKALRDVVELEDRKGLDWEQKYNLVFGPLGTKNPDMPTLDYYDPDAGYEDDVRAYCQAAKALLECMEAS